MSRITQEREAQISLQDLHTQSLPFEYPQRLRSEQLLLKQYILHSGAEIYLVQFPNARGEEVSHIFNAATARPQKYVVPAGDLADYVVVPQAQIAQQQGIDNEAVRVVREHLMSPGVGYAFRSFIPELSYYIGELSPLVNTRPLSQRIIVADLDKYTNWFYRNSQNDYGINFFGQRVKDSVISTHLSAFMRFRNVPGNIVVAWDQLNQAYHQDPVKLFEQYMRKKKALKDTWANYEVDPTVDAALLAFFPTLPLEDRVTLVAEELLGTGPGNYLDPTTGRVFLGETEAFFTSFGEGSVTIVEDRQTTTFTLYPPNEETGQYRLESMKVTRNPLYPEDGLTPVFAWMKSPSGAIRVLSGPLTRRLAGNRGMANALGRAIIASESPDVQHHMPSHMILRDGGPSMGILGVQAGALLFGRQFSRRLGKQPILQKMMDIFSANVS